MKILFLILIILGSLIISCSNSTEPDYNKYYNELSNLDAKQTIEKGNEWRDSAPKIKTHITSTEVIVEFPDGRVVNKSLPDNLMYIAVAPYLNTTHECSTHYPSSCKGEITEKSVKLTAKDEDGTIYFDENMTTLKYGFFELWLPRNRNIKLELKFNSFVGEETIQTNSDSRTCITTIRLK